MQGMYEMPGEDEGSEQREILSAKLMPHPLAPAKKSSRKPQPL